MKTGLFRAGVWQRTGLALVLGWLLTAAAWGATVVTPSGSTIVTSVSDTAHGARMQVTITPSASELDSTQNMYYALVLPNGMLLFRSPLGWEAWTEGPIPALFQHAQTECRSGASFGFHVDLPTPLADLALLGLRGATFYAGYGDNEVDLIRNVKYAPLYTVPLR